MADSPLPSDFDVIDASGDDSAEELQNQSGLALHGMPNLDQMNHLQLRAWMKSNGLKNSFKGASIAGCRNAVTCDSVVFCSVLSRTEGLKLPAPEAQLA